MHRYRVSVGCFCVNFISPVWLHNTSQYKNIQSTENTKKYKLYTDKKNPNASHGNQYKKPVQRARKTARCAICQYPQSTLLIGTACSMVHGVTISQKTAGRHPSKAASFGNFPIQLTQNMLSLPYDEVYESIADGHFTFKTCHGTLSHS